MVKPRCVVLRSLATRALAVLAPRPAAGSAPAFLQLFPCTPNAALAGSRLLGILDPADELIAGQRRDVLPGIERRGVGDQRLTQVCGQFMYDPTGQSLVAHWSMVLSGGTSLTIGSWDYPRRGRHQLVPKEIERYALGPEVYCGTAVGRPVASVQHTATHHTRCGIMSARFHA